jgi:hypothetical protein
MHPMRPGKVTAGRDCCPFPSCMDSGERAVPNVLEIDLDPS